MNDGRLVELLGGPMDGRTLVVHEGSSLRISQAKSRFIQDDVDPDPRPRDVLGEYDIEEREGRWVGLWRPA